jgi:protein SCO1
MHQTSPQVAPHHVRGTYELIDHNGREVNRRTYRGKHVVIFFGFTHCKEVCPRALSRLSAVLDRLGPRAERIQPLYLTVDPHRDTPAVMKDFLASAYPRFTGLTGSAQQIEWAKRSFRVFSTGVSDLGEPCGYRMPHAASTYVLGPDGAYLTHFTDAVEEDELTVALFSIVE